VWTRFWNDCNTARLPYEVSYDISIFQTPCIILDKVSDLLLFGVNSTARNFELTSSRRSSRGFYPVARLCSFRCKTSVHHHTSSAHEATHR
jgi:hypothetical protein